MKKIQKICSNHPEEVLKFNDDVWSKILETFFGVAQNRLIYKKKYAKDYLKKKMTGFIRSLMAHVSFEHLISTTLMTQPKLRYKAMRELVTEVFLDKRAENSIC